MIDSYDVDGCKFTLPEPSLQILENQFTYEMYVCLPVLDSLNTEAFSSNFDQYLP